MPSLHVFRILLRTVVDGSDSEVIECLGINSVEIGQSVKELTQSATIEKDILTL